MRRTPARALVTVAALTFTGIVLPSAPAVAASPPSTPYTMGDNGFGQLGNGSTVDRRNAGAVNTLTDVIDLHGGREHVTALRANGTVWTWGSNQEGQIGNGSTANALNPVQVPGLSNIIAVETGHNFSMALRQDGTVWQWGLNTDGQLGDGSLTNRRSPVQVTGLTDAVAIAGGRNMSYAIRSNGQVWAWGRNDEGQLGDGTSTRRTAPVRVGTLTDIVRIAGGRDHGMAVTSAGTLWTWGSNDYGQIGDGTNTDRRSPVQVTGLTGLADVAAGAHHSFALRTNGTVASWGRNYRANLGDGTGTQRTRPVAVLDVAGATTIGAMRDGGIVTLSDGRAKTWGDNASGQLGDGTLTNRNRAIFVPGVANAVKAGGGGAGYSVLLQSFEPQPNQDPVARITGSCNGLSCPLSGGTSSDDGTITSYSWDFGDGTPLASGVAPGHVYAEAGTYTVTLTVTDDDGATDSATLQVTVAPVPNAAPVARITGACSGLSCPLSGATSSDDGTITSYSWDFGDGTPLASGVAPGHTYAAAGTYTVSLTVTDNEGVAGSTSVQVTVADTPPPTVAFRAAAAKDSNVANPFVVVPAAVQAGDQLVLVVTVANTTSTLTTPAGWTLLSSVADGTDMRSYLLTRSATATTGGSTLQLTLSALAKSSIVLSAYSGSSGVSAFASAAEAGAPAAHTAPNVTVATAGSTVVRYWADKSSTAHGWTLPGGLTGRASSTGSGGGFVTATLGDAAGAPAGAAGTSVATAGVASDKAVAWSIVIG